MHAPAEHTFALLALGVCLSIVACQNPTAPAAVGESTSSAAGHWSMDGTNRYFAGLVFSLQFRDSVGLSAVGNAAAFRADCPKNPLECGLTGIVINATQLGPAISVSISFAQAPIGITIEGTLRDDGTLRGQLFVRDGTPTPPPAVNVLFRRPPA